MLTFFGLAPEYRRILHEQVFSLIYYGKGGFTWADVMSMPTWLRLFYIKQINKAVEAENERNKKASKKPTGVARPGITPTKAR
jgi:hypothetical protein